ncbi:aspartate aminotransferase family protein [Pyrobaculum aerophilum]|uniref:pyridoxal phosphate-dependent decarboxylase family protein n=1 Tax=Pyrobaculum aerophilum TaxID=13773 RepID=UPI002FDB8389
MSNMELNLEKIEALDLMTPGKFFAYLYETGNNELKNIAFKTLLQFYDKNMLDFTVYKSAIYFEKQVINFTKELLHGDQDVVGTFTYGGTESIMLAVLSARNSYWKKWGKDVVPELVAPFTIHPAFLKAAHYLGLKVKIVDINHNKKVDVEALKNAITNKTALVAVSAPNWPYGTIDPVKEVAEITREKNILLHVDACVGGFILPFFEKLGEKVEPFDFRVEGVTSISADIHKYGYAPKGASVVLFKNADLKKESIFVDLTNPGYIFVNTAVLSSRSVGPLAAAYATITYLRSEGYLQLAKQILEAREKILLGLKKLGFDTLGPLESPILSLTNQDIDLVLYTLEMRKRGWHFHLQRGVSRYNIPINIHLAISPVHKYTAVEFVKDSQESIEKIRGMKFEIRLEEILQDVQTGKIDSSIAPILVDMLNPEFATSLVKDIVIAMYK